eukprot:352392-Chlamydomonas_euryale.AAC.1
MQPECIVGGTGNLNGCRGRMQPEWIVGSACNPNGRLGGPTPDRWMGRRMRDADGNGYSNVSTQCCGWSGRCWSGGVKALHERFGQRTRGSKQRCIAPHLPLLVHRQQRQVVALWLEELCLLLIRLRLLLLRSEENVLRREHGQDGQDLLAAAEVDRCDEDLKAVWRGCADGCFAPRAWPGWSGSPRCSRGRPMR